jgi:hypothetical protein
MVNREYIMVNGHDIPIHSRQRLLHTSGFLTFYVILYKIVTIFKHEWSRKPVAFSFLSE